LIGSKTEIGVLAHCVWALLSASQCPQLLRLSFFVQLAQPHADGVLGVAGFATFVGATQVERDEVARARTPGSDLAFFPNPTKPRSTHWVVIIFPGRKQSLA